MEDEMEEVVQFELPSYLEWMDQHDRDQFVRGMNNAGKNVGDLKDITDEDLEEFGIAAGWTRELLLGEIQFYSELNEEAGPFEIPDYLKAVMNQHEQVVFARNMNMNYRNESDLEDMTPDDFENLGIHSAKTHRFMRRAILAHFDPGFTERVRVWQNEINAPQTGAVDAVLVDAVLVEEGKKPPSPRSEALERGNHPKRKAPEGGKGKEPEEYKGGKGYFKIRKPLGEKDINADKNLRLSMDNEMEFTKFKSDTIQVSLAEPPMESFLYFVFSANNAYEFACMRVPPKTGFYKAINWIYRDFKEVPFKSSKYPNPMSVMGGYMGAGKDSKLYWKKRHIGYITLKNWTNQTVNLMDVGEWQSVYSMIKMVQNFKFEDYFLTKQGYFFREHILYPGTEYEYYNDSGIPDELRNSLGKSNMEFKKYFDNKYGYGDSLKGDLREQFKEKDVSTIEQFVSQIFLPYTLKQGSDLKTEYDDKKSRMDQLMKNKDDWETSRNLEMKEDDYLEMQRLLIKKDGFADTETEFTGSITYLENSLEKLKELMATYNYINGRETSEQIDILYQELRISWRALKYKCYDCIWEAFMGAKLAKYDDPSFALSERNPRFPLWRIHQFEEFVEKNKPNPLSTSHLFTNRLSFRDVDFTVSYVLEHLLKDHQGERIDGWIYINTQTLIKNIPDHNSYKWNEDQKHKFVRRPNNYGLRSDFHSEINVFNASRDKFDYEGASEENPYVVAYKDMKFRSKFEGMRLSELSY